MLIIDKCRAAAVCLCLGAGGLLSSSIQAAQEVRATLPAQATQPVQLAQSSQTAQSSTTKRLTAPAKQGAIQGAIDEAGVRALLAQAGDPALHVLGVSKGQDGGFAIHLIHNATSLPAPATYLAHVAQALLRQAQALHQHQVPVEQLEFTTFIPQLLSNGQGGVKVGEGKMQMFAFTVLKQDYQQVNWPKVDHRLMLDVAEITFSPVARRVAERFCQGKSGMDQSPLFCAAVASGQKKEAMSVLLKQMAPVAKQGR